MSHSHSCEKIRLRTVRDRSQRSNTKALPFDWNSLDNTFNIPYWCYKRKLTLKGKALQTICSATLIHTATLAFCDNTDWKWIYAEHKTMAQ
jgi:hypothetical protein